MAVGQKPAKGVILRTPAPKAEAKLGGSSYGEAQDVYTPSSIPPGTRVTSELGKNLSESVDDSVMDRVLSKGVSGRGDFVAQDESDQFRPVSADGYPPAVGMHNPNKPAGTYDALPSKGQGTSSAKPVRQP